MREASGVLTLVEQHRCECPTKSSGYVLLPGLFGFLPEEEKARAHEPNECLGDYDVALYLRNGEELWLCSCCCLSGDQRIGEVLDA